MSRPSIIYPYGPNESTCGYCSPPGSRSDTEYNRTSASLQALALTCDVYQRMIDRGWRRSGTYCYKPDMKNSCCPQYTIKLDALQFKPSKSQRKLMRRWNNFVERGDNSDAMTTEDKAKRPPRPNKSEDESGSLSSLLHAVEVPWVDPETTRHRFETVLEPSSYTDEKFELFKKYQADIHHDFKSSQSGFRRFLCETPLRTSPISYTGSPPAHLPVEYGSHHQLYRLDGELIAMAVLDILPSCVSSVYFMYDKKWERFSLGKLSAFRETSLACEIHQAGASQMSYLYMGFYIHSCPKMRYKGEYSPSFLVDPENYEWYPLETCVKFLSKNRYACFSSPEHSTSDPPPEYIEDAEPDPIPTEDLAQINIVRAARRGQVMVEPINEARCWSSEDARSLILHCIHGLGTGLSKEVIFTLQF
ncbi:hypothetical protein BDN71DRAFT_1443310 [Pleurotus eryngii]|uniref:Arginyl-tRNA--protein transferase 1 n=1 Tax=Pleurotus eryngii TaxID=5323 RepID=A0A9P6A1Y7_PLEER|nr:hypothetical protein BDN71DRAFT_1443310 [Pleurotus eryngii]